MLSYSSTFFRSLGISVAFVGIPSLFFYSSFPESYYNSISIANNNYGEEFVEEEMEQISNKNHQQPWINRGGEFLGN